VILNIRKTMTVTPRSVGMTIRILRIIKASIGGKIGEKACTLSPLKELIFRAKRS
jgi:hypothetical protein